MAVIEELGICRFHAAKLIFFTLFHWLYSDCRVIDGGAAFSDGNFCKKKYYMNRLESPWHDKSWNRFVFLMGLRRQAPKYLPSTAHFLWYRLRKSECQLVGKSHKFLKMVFYQQLGLSFMFSLEVCHLQIAAGVVDGLKYPTRSSSHMFDTENPTLLQWGKSHTSCSTYRNTWRFTNRCFCLEILTLVQGHACRPSHMPAMRGTNKMHAHTWFHLTFSSHRQLIFSVLVRWQRDTL